MKNLFILASIQVFLIFSLNAQILTSQLTDPYFPDRNPSSRTLTNNKRLFKAYKDQQMIITLVCRNVNSADLEINGHKIDIKSMLQFAPPGTDIPVNITKYLKDGNDNTLSIQNIRPTGSNLLAYVPFPKLTYGTPESVGISPQLLQKVDDLIKKDVANGFPGATLIIAKNGKIVKEAAYGYKRKFTDDGKLMDHFDDMEIDTLFDMASNTKMFATIFSLMKLFSDGLVNYLNPLKKYIEEYKGVDRKGHNRDNINVVDVLTHIAGYISTYSFYSEKVECYSRSKKTTENCICKNIDLSREKGGEPVYSDIDYILGGLLVEHLSHMELQDYVQKFIYRPLGLKHTGFTPLKNGFKKEDCAATEVFGNTRNNTINFKDIRTKVIQCEVHDEVSYYSMNETSGHAGLFSTVRDLAVLGQVLLNRGGYGNVKLWTKDTQDLFVKPYDMDMSFGIGWRRQANELLTWHFGTYASNEAIGHTGWTGTVTVIDPVHDLTVILLTNKKHSPYIKGEFEGDYYETGKFGSVMQLIYESFLNNNA